TDLGKFTRAEIFSQPEAWAEALDVVEKCKSELANIFAADYDQVLFTGCGSTYYLSLAAAALFQEMTGKLARAVPGGELLLNELTVLTGGKTLLVAISRSGSTTETVRAVENFKQHNLGPVLAITNYGDQPLAGLADVALVIEKGQEQSVAQTRSFASMYVAATAMSLLAGGRELEYQSMRRLPEAGAKLIAEYDALAQKFGANLAFDRFYFLGSGIRYGLACEVNLKMKEMTLTHSEPFHFLEYRHGPMSMVNENALIVGLVSEKNFSHEQAVLNEMQALGGNVLALGESGLDVCFDSGIPEAGRAVLYLPVLQLMAFYRSLAKGLNPDRPTNLTAVVKINL
ncbi:MAG: SIS domain-containing protein, partial [Anaerolineae bacterium]|nr:SIS domain-containing protein [Anaerolineae bacterium]